MTTHPRFDQLIADGLAASQDGHSGIALNLFAQAAAEVPGSGMPHFLIGSEHAGGGNFAEAEAAFANAVLLAPDFALARYQLGLLQFCTGRAAVALVTWQALHALPEDAALGHFARGFAELAIDRFDAAVSHFMAGLRCQDANPAVSADIEKLIHEVERLAAAARARADAPDASGDAASQAGTGVDASQVLLAGYSKTLH